MRLFAWNTHIPKAGNSLHGTVVALKLHCSFLQVCREYQRGNCSRGENDCRFAHPADSTMIDTNDNTVTVCMDYIKGRCSREKCKYFHPPAHLQAKIKAAQHQVNQATAAAAMVSSPDEHTHVQSHAYRLRSRFWERFPELQDILYALCSYTCSCLPFSHPPGWYDVAIFSFATGFGSNLTWGGWYEEELDNATLSLCI